MFVSSRRWLSYSSVESVSKKRRLTLQALYLPKEEKSSWAIAYAFEKGRIGVKISQLKLKLKMLLQEKFATMQELCLTDLEPMKEDLSGTRLEQEMSEVTKDDHFAMFWLQSNLTSFKNQVLKRVQRRFESKFGKRSLIAEEYAWIRKLQSRLKTQRKKIVMYERRDDDDEGPSVDQTGGSDDGKANSLVGKADVVHINKLLHCPLLILQSSISHSKQYLPSLSRLIQFITFTTISATSQDSYHRPLLNTNVPQQEMTGLYSCPYAWMSTSILHQVLVQHVLVALFKTIVSTGTLHQRDCSRYTFYIFTSQTTQERTFSCYSYLWVEEDDHGIEVAHRIRISNLVFYIPDLDGITRLQLQHRIPACTMSALLLQVNAKLKDAITKSVGFEGLEKVHDVRTFGDLVSSYLVQIK
ncbi:hypothetical protein Tco_0530119 [Tanacetum coccineum]